MAIEAKREQSKPFEGDDESNLDTVTVTPSEMAQRYLRLDGNWFSLEDREYLLPIYDVNFKRLVIKAGRQTEKTVFEEEPVLDEWGRKKPIKDFEVGESVATLDNNRTDMTTGRITWKSRRYRKKCLKVTTDLKHEIIVGRTHPLRRFGEWTPASNISEGDRIAVARDINPESPGDPQPEDEIKFLGYMISDGILPNDIIRGSCFGFSQEKGSETLRSFKKLCQKMDFNYNEITDTDGNGVDLRFNKNHHGAFGLIKKYGLLGTRSGDKYIPEQLMKLPENQIEILLGALWSCDGSVLMHGKSSQEITYCSTSKKLANQAQSLLLRLGIPSKIRENKPELYKGTDNVSYLVTVRTRKGIDTFLSRVDATDAKTDPLQKKSNDNRDTIPKKIGDTIRNLVDNRSVSNYGDSLNSNDLRRSPKYALTWNKLNQYIDFFENREGFDQSKIDFLKRQRDTDVVWDKVKNVEEVGEKWCYDLEVGGTNNFLVDGVITHNSTTLSNKIVLNNVLNDFYSTLYVTPSMDQTQRFSNTRLDPTLKKSPYIYKNYFKYGPKKNVYEKHLTNGSVMWLSYAGDTADRIRGISAEEVFIDEIQDVRKENIPVIEEVMSHAENPQSTYTGTPKSQENTIETYWKNSTQHEWVVKCTGCNHYNILGWDNIGKKGPICSNCGKEINPLQHGQWTWMQDPEEVGRWGFRINQLMVPWIINNEEKWKDLLFKIENEYSKKEVNNEILGLPYSAVDQPITRDDLKKCVDDFPMVENPGRKYTTNPVFAGIDIGSGDAGELGDDAKSYTCLTFLYRMPSSQWKAPFIKRYEGREADEEYAMNDMIKWIDKFKPTYIGIDWGLSGFHRSKLRNRFGFQKVIPIFYRRRLRERFKWNEKALRLTANRPETMIELYNDILQQDILFPRWDDTSHLLQDFLNVYKEVDNRGSIQFTHPDNKPDDIVHSTNYARIAGTIYYNDIRLEMKGHDSGWES